MNDFCGAAGRNSDFNGWNASIPSCAVVLWQGDLSADTLSAVAARFLRPVSPLIIAFITHSADIRQILDHIGVGTEPPRITPARGPPLWNECDAQMGDGVDVEADWDDAAQTAPDFEVDQRVTW